MARQKPYVTVLFDKIAFPSAGAARMETEGGHSVPRTLSPFHTVKSAEEALAVRMAMDSGVTFKYIAKDLKHNVDLGLDTIKAELAKEYQMLKDEGWLKEHFDPQAAIKSLESSLRQAIPGLQAAGSEGHRRSDGVRKPGR